MRCPVGGDEMVRETLHGVHIDVSAKGIWMDKGELFSITESERYQAPEWLFADLFRSVESPEVDKDRTLPCPVCQKAMELERHHEVWIDWCKDHGIWLDSGEFEAMLNNLRLDQHFLGKITTRLWEMRF